MSKMGKIYKMIDKNHGYIIDINGNLYLFSSFDIIDDTKIKEGLPVLFKVKEDLVLRATYISSFNG